MLSSKAIAKYSYVSATKRNRNSKPLKSEDMSQVNLDLETALDEER